MSLYGYAAIFGLGFGGTFSMIQLVITEFFEGRSFARILGLLTSVDVACGGITITLLARMRTAFGGSYLPAIEILIGLTCVNALYGADPVLETPQVRQPAILRLNRNRIEYYPCT